MFPLSKEGGGGGTQLYIFNPTFVLSGNFYSIKCVTKPLISITRVFINKENEKSLFTIQVFEVEKVVVIVGSIFSFL